MNYENILEEINSKDEFRLYEYNYGDKIIKFSNLKNNTMNDFFVYDSDRNELVNSSIIKFGVPIIKEELDEIFAEKLNVLDFDYSKLIKNELEKDLEL